MGEQEIEDVVLACLTRCLQIHFFLKHVPINIAALVVVVNIYTQSELLPLQYLSFLGGNTPSRLVLSHSIASCCHSGADATFRLVKTAYARIIDEGI